MDACPDPGSSFSVALTATHRFSIGPARSRCRSTGLTSSTDIILIVITPTRSLEAERIRIAMHMRILSAGLASFCGATALIASYLMLPEGTGPTPATAAENAVTFPPLEQLEHYTTVRRGITREHMLTSRE